MKKLIFVFFLFISVSALAQSSDSIKKAAKPGTICICTPPDTTKSALYIIDGKIVKGKIDKINPNDILSISVLKSDSTTAKYGSAGANGVILITTKGYATQQYRKKFSSFSKAYENYLKAHRNDDSELSYVINGEVMSRDSKLISLLFDLPKNNITYVNMLKEFQGHKTNLVIISTDK